MDTKERRAFIARLLNVIGLGILGACRMPRIVASPYQPAGPSALSPLFAPTLVVTGTTATTVSLLAVYTAPPAGTNYVFQQASNQGGPFSTIATQASGTLTASGLTTGVTYYFRAAMIVSDGRQTDWSAIASGSTAASTADAFPRLAGVAVNGSGSFWTASAQAQMAKRHLSMLGFYRGWSGNNGTHPNKPTIEANVFAASTLRNRPRLAPYGIWSDIDKTPGSSSLAVGNSPWENACISAQALLYTNGIAHTGPVNSFYSASAYHCNNSKYAPNVGGTNSWKYFTNFLAGWQFQGTDPTSLDPADSSQNAVFLDAIWQYLDVAGDYNLSGSSTPAHTSHVDQAGDQWMRDGMALYLAYVRSVYGSKAIIGNVINPMDVYKNPSIVGLTGLMDYALSESAIGLPSSEDTYGGSSYVIQGYQQMENLGAPIIHQDGFVNGTTGQDYMSTLRGDPNWQAARYGMALVAMRNGYYANTINQNYNIDSAFDIDEMDNAGRYAREWLGDPSGTSQGGAQSAVWSNGIWRRDYANGIVLWYPRTATGNVSTVDATSRTVNLGGTFYRLTGTQDSSTNSGVSVTSVTFTRDRDGLFLSRAPT